MAQQNFAGQKLVDYEIVSTVDYGDHLIKFFSRASLLFIK